MGFGSYDESEQEKQQLDTDADDENIEREKTAHDGDLSFETGSTDELIDKLHDIKAEQDDSEE